MPILGPGPAPSPKTPQIYGEAGPRLHTFGPYKGRRITRAGVSHTQNYQELSSYRPRRPGAGKLPKRTQSCPIWVLLEHFLAPAQNRLKIGSKRSDLDQFGPLSGPRPEMGRKRSDLGPFGLLSGPRPKMVPKWSDLGPFGQLSGPGPKMGSKSADHRSCVLEPVEGTGFTLSPYPSPTGPRPGHRRKPLKNTWFWAKCAF